MKNRGLDVAAITLQAQMVLDGIAYGFVQIVFVQVFRDFGHSIPEPLCIGSLDDQCGHIAEEVSAENHVKGDINHDEYHFSDVDRVNVSVACQTNCIIN